MGYFSKQDMLEDLYGRGAGDPDVHGHYPGDPDENNCRLCNPQPKHKTPNIYRKKHWSEVVRNPNSTYGPREPGDNEPASPEQAGY